MDTQEAAQTIPAGWYVDPEGPDPDGNEFMRWWNGAEWAEERRPRTRADGKAEQARLVASGLIPPPARPWYRARWVGPAAIAALIAVIGLTGVLKPPGETPGDAPSGGSSPGGTTAALACINSVAAIQEFSEGRRSTDSALTVLRAEEDRARNAASVNPKWEGLVGWITAAQREVAAIEVGEGTRQLVTACGSAAP